MSDAWRKVIKFGTISFDEKTREILFTNFIVHANDSDELTRTIIEVLQDSLYKTVALREK